MKEYIDALRKQIADNPPDLDGSKSVLAFLYESYSQVNRMDDDRIKADFNTLYQAMNGMSLREMDKILDPVCMLCRDHEQAGVVKGIRIADSYCAWQKDGNKNRNGLLWNKGKSVQG